MRVSSAGSVGYLGAVWRRGVGSSRLGEERARRRARRKSRWRKLVGTPGGGGQRGGREGRKAGGGSSRCYSL